MKQEKNKKKKGTPLLPLLLMLLIGGACGFFAVSFLPDSVYDLPFPQFFGFLLLFLLLLYLFFFLHTVIHEGGHLLFGLLTGYRFSSFRIGPFMLLRRGGKLHFSRLSLAGTGGQCLLAPPPMRDGKCPTFLYNLGGSLMNLLFAAASGLFAYLFRADEYAFLFFIVFAAIGAVQALVNGIPMRLGMVDNDGYNAISIRKNEASMLAFHRQLAVSAALTEGVRLSEMPEEYFTLPPNGDLKNSMVAVIAVFHANRLMDAGDYAAADAEMQALLAAETGMVDIHRNLLLCDRIFCALYAGRPEEARTIYSEKAFLNFLKTMKSFPTVMRTEYIAATRLFPDDKKAAAAKARFEKCAKSYPYPTDIATERRLLALAAEEKTENAEI